jgi:hypothetical protein
LKNQNPIETATIINKIPAAKLKSISSKKNTVVGKTVKTTRKISTVENLSKVFSVFFYN